jgi:hypothetical protein
MTEPQSTTEYNVIDWRISLINLRNLTHLAIRHLEPIEYEDLPDDAEFRQILWTLSNHMRTEADRINHMYETLGLAGVDDRRIKTQL